MKRLLLLLDSMIYFDRQILKGIKARLDETNLKVRLYLESGSALDELIQEPWDYVIVDYDKDKFRNIVQTCNAKILAYSNHHRDDFSPNASSIVIDNQSLSEAALRRFLNAGLTHVSFFANEQDAEQPWGQERKEAFIRQSHHINIDYVESVFKAIKAQQFPLGVYCSSDRSARKLAQYCELNRIDVPTQISIIGTDSDNTERMLSPLPLSSLDLNPYELGRYCVDTLIKTIRFKRRFHYTYAPTQFYEAATTTHCQEQFDDLVSRASLYMHNNFHMNIKIKQVTDFCKTSRKTLDSRFLSVHGETAHQHLTNIRLRRAQYLLLHSTDKLDTIAQQCGYPNQSYLTQVFGKQIGISPSQYRENSQAGENNPTDPQLDIW